MTREYQYGTIPASFVEYDSTFMNEDRFVNVSQLQRVRLNHNALIAERVRRPVANVVCSKYEGTAFALLLGFADSDPNTLPTFIDEHVLLSQQTQQCEFKIRAKTSTGITVTINPMLLPPFGTETTRDPDDVSMSVTATSETSYTATVPVPPDLPRNRYGYMLARFRAMFSTSLDFSTPKSSGNAIYRSGPQWFYGAANPTAGDIVWFSNTAIEPRLVTHVETDVSSGYVISVDRPFNRIPRAGTDTYAYDDPPTMSLYTWSLYEKIVTSFTAPAGVV